MAAAQAVVSILSRMGRPWTIRHATETLNTQSPWKEGTLTKTYVTVQAHGRNYRPHETKPPVQERDILVTMAGHIATPPVPGDYVAAGTFTSQTDSTAKWGQVINVTASSEGEAVGAYQLQVRY